MSHTFIKDQLWTRHCSVLAYNGASRSTLYGGWNVRLLGVSGSVMSSMSVTTDRAQSRDTTRARHHFQLSDHRRIHRWGQSSPWDHPWRMPRLPGERAPDMTGLAMSRGPTLQQSLNLASCFLLSLSAQMPEKTERWWNCLSHDRTVWHG